MDAAGAFQKVAFGFAAVVLFMWVLSATSRSKN
jgi:hypothetical protein